jgi:hypothetical protein
MSRELNPPREILRRLLFVVCMAGGLAAGIFLLMALASRQPDRIFMALLTVGASILSFFIGHRSFNFSGLTATFPVGGEEPDIDIDVRQELEALLQDIDDPDTNWMTRHELRKKLANFIQKEPRLLDLYGSEIRSAYPFSAGRSLKNDR